MPDALVITFLPDKKSISVTSRWSLRDAAIVAGINLAGTCGGNGVCGKCKVKLLDGDIDISPDENGILLACRAFPKSDCTLEIPPESIAQTPKTVLRGISETLPVDSPALKNLSDSDPVRHNAYGVALDIGTTNIVAALVSLTDGRIAATSSTENPQAIHGGDVISRIAYSSRVGGLDELRKLLTDALENLITKLCENAGASKNAIVDIVVSGNATMNHILAGVSPESLGKAPYNPAFLEHGPIPASELGFSLHPVAHLRIVPNIAGFVGGDTTSGILASGLYKSSGIKLFLDIGTNGEIVLGSADGLIATSAAAGPAFEGGGIEHGMRAEPGAIERVVFKGGIRISTVDNVRSRGICGTGVIQAVGCMVETGLIDKSGRIISPDEAADMPWGFGNRIRENENGRRIVLW
ncbi:MAG TPA: DUF4445 domain-containing protein, partial [Firmicutes bacterium]|nr:DUF4445 domain-containing protein [Bacillota bacterium]